MKFKWFMVDKTGKVYLYDVIGYDDNSAKEFARIVQEMQDKGVTQFDVHINSPGGFLTDGLAIYNLMKDLNCTVYIDGLAASAASLIAMGGKKIFMHESSMLMIHNPSASARGDHEDMKKAAEVMEQFRDTALKAYTAKTKQPEAQIIAWMDEEKWFNAEDARAAGFVDEVIKNATNSLGEDPMNEFLIKLLGLKKDAKEEEIKAALEALNISAQPLSRIEQLEEMVTAPPAAPAKPDEALMDKVEKLMGDLDKVNKELANTKANAALEKAVNDGKIIPAQKEDYRAEALADPAAFSAKMEKREKIWDPAKKIPVGPKPEDVKNPLQAAAEFIRSNRAN